MIHSAINGTAMQIDELTTKFFAWNARNRAPATLAFYRARLKKFCAAYNGRDLASLTPLEIDEHVADAGAGMSDTTRHHNAVALERLQKFAIQNKLLDKPVFGILEKPRTGRRDRVPTPTETEAILARASPESRRRGRRNPNWPRRDAFRQESRRCSIRYARAAPLRRASRSLPPRFEWIPRGHTSRARTRDTFRRVRTPSS